jgi:hypothetical protein
MWWIVTIAVLVAGGLLGASNMIISKRPNAKELIDKLVPYQGIIGVIMLLWGLRDAVWALRLLDLIGIRTGWWLIWLICAITQLGLGFLLGYSLIAKYALGTNQQVTEKAEKLRTRLSAYQGVLGITALVLAVIFFLTSVGH